MEGVREVCGRCAGGVLDRSLSQTLNLKLARSIERGLPDLMQQALSH